MSEYLLKKEPFALLSTLIDTNITSKDFQSLIKEMSLFDSDRLLFQNVVGKPVVVEDKTLHFPLFEGELLKSNVNRCWKQWQARKPGTMSRSISGLKS